MPGTNLTRAEAEARAAAVSTETYAIELDLTTSEDTFRSTSTVTFAATAGAETFIDLIAPEVVEFWQGRENRVHNRIRVIEGRTERLQP